MRRLPVRDSSKNFEFLVDSLPEYAPELLSSIDRPLTVLTCKQTNQRYIASEFNRNKDSYRSPWSNEYSTSPTKPKSSNTSLGSACGYEPPKDLRELEIVINNMLKHYVKLYYDEGIASAYAWETVHGLAVAVLIKKGIFFKFLQLV